MHVVLGLMDFYWIGNLCCSLDINFERLVFIILVRNNEFLGCGK